MPTAQKSATAKTQTLSFEAPLLTIAKWHVIKLPKEVSAKLPSRGQVMVEGTLNDHSFATPLEPDGMWGHWFSPSPELRKQLSLKPGDNCRLTITATKSWPEPAVPADLHKELQAHPKALELWQRITPMARWEWIRWSRATANSETRKKRLQVACSKLEKGMRRPCCWNRNLCTEPSISKNGVLLDS